MSIIQDDLTLSERVAQGVELAIREGRYSLGQPLPSHRELCRQYSVSLNTVRGALDILEGRGLIFRRERSGTFVHPAGLKSRRPAQETPLRCVTFIEEEHPEVRARIRSDYAVGCTEAYDQLDLKTRFATWHKGAKDYAGYLADRFEPSEQGCLLVTVKDRGLMEWLDRRKIPFVVLYYCYYPTDSLPPHHRVYVNKVAAGFEATRHLLALGHERIGFGGVSVGPDGLPGLYDGYHAAMLCAGVGHRADDVLEFRTDEMGAALDSARQYLRRVEGISAVFAQTDAIAIALIQAGAELGMRVPDDLSVIGFNDLPEAAEADPPLTTVASPRRLLGRTAAELLLSAAGNPCREPQSRVLNCQLVLRRSTAPPRREPVRRGKSGHSSKQDHCPDKEEAGLCMSDG